MQYLCLAAFVRFFSVWLFTTASFLADLLFALHSIYSDGLLCFLSLPSNNTLSPYTISVSDKKLFSQNHVYYAIIQCAIC